MVNWFIQEMKWAHSRCLFCFNSWIANSTLFYGLIGSMPLCIICVGYLLYSLHVCVCVGASGSTTASENISNSVLCVVCVGRFPRGVPGGGKYAPPGYM
jgi:hypothetical protein